MKNYKIQFILILLFLLNPIFILALDCKCSISPIVKSERNKVVHISTWSTQKLRLDPFFEPFFHNVPRERQQSSLGSGFIISADGYILTNNHVVKNANKIEVILSNEQKYKAKIIGTDPRTDLALIKIKMTNLPFVKLGKSADIEVGDPVIAIGNPLGLDYTVTTGIISAKGRDILGGTAYGQFLQTDAAINPGNSGGPLMNYQGEVIGINTAIIAGGQGLGFAIPIDLVQKVIKDLKTYGKVERGWFGIGIQDINEELSESFGLNKKIRGIAITSVMDDSPAAKAGLKVGDILFQYDNQKVKKSSELQRLVAETTIGKKIVVNFYRENQKGIWKKTQLTVKIGSLPDQQNSNHKKIGKNIFGLKLTKITPKIQKQYKLNSQKGLLITYVTPNGLAQEAGLQPGDVILKINRIKLNNEQHFFKSLKLLSKKHKKSVVLYINRRNAYLFVRMPLEKH